MTVLGSCSPVM